MENKLEKIFKINSKINVVIQVQSYGRVFIYDQLGVVVPQEDAICVYTSENDSGIDERINKGLDLFLKKCEEL